MEYGSELKNARVSRGLTLRKLAEFGKTSAAAINQIENGHRGVSVERLNSLLLKTRHRLIVLPTIAYTVGEVAQGIRGFVLQSDWQAAYREFLTYSDSLKKQDPAIKVALTILTPEPTGSEIFDAGIAGITEYWLNQEGLPLPSWTAEDSRFLSVNSVLAETSRARPPELTEVPEEFLRRGVLLSIDALQSV